MAVYTLIKNNHLMNFLDDYKIGKLHSFEGILEGVENTNYKIVTSKDKYILTIFEKRVNIDELPFFIELQKHLSNKSIKCPKPIPDRNNNYINLIKEKKCVIMSFLEGKKLKSINPKHCYQIGEELAKMHQNTKDFKLKRENDLRQNKWKKIFEKSKNSNNSKYHDLFSDIENELNFLEKNWPEELPKGVIHADVFQDNVFFIKENVC